MDYPHPWVTLDASGKPTLDKAYTVGIGAWDKAAIRFGYSEFAPGTDEKAALNGLLLQNEKDGLRYITDEDSRPLGGANPYGHLWDNGPDAAAELDRILEVRKAALARFNQNAIRVGEPMSQLEETLVPLYLLHRFQTEAASKLIGGLDYRYAVRGDGAMVTEMITPERQRKALTAVLQTLDPGMLTLSPEFLAILPPVPPGYPRTGESFKGYTGLTFDPQGAVEASAGLTASLLFDPSRASRLVQYHAQDDKSPGLDEVIDQTIQTTWESPRQPGVLGQTQFSVETVLLKALMQLSISKQASPQARAIAQAKLSDLEDWLSDQLEGDIPDSVRAHWFASLDDIERFWKDPDKFIIAPVLTTPPGQPIGSEDDDEDFQLE
jgi:hypothetical protein